IFRNCLKNCCVDRISDSEHSIAAAGVGTTESAGLGSCVRAGASRESGALTNDPFVVLAICNAFERPTRNTLPPALRRTSGMRGAARRHALSALRAGTVD